MRWTMWARETVTVLGLVARPGSRFLEDIRDKGLKEKLEKKRREGRKGKGRMRFGRQRNGMSGDNHGSGRWVPLDAPELCEQVL